MCVCRTTANIVYVLDKKEGEKNIEWLDYNPEATAEDMEWLDYNPEATAEDMEWLDYNPEATAEDMEWLDYNPEATAEEFQAKKKEVEDTANPILYQQAGGAPPPSEGGEWYQCYQKVQEYYIIEAILYIQCTIPYFLIICLYFRVHVGRW